MENTKKELTLQQQIKAKQKEIEHYTGVLDRYWEKNGNGRWYNMGRRTLEGLVDDKKLLKKKFKKQLRQQLVSRRKTSVTKICLLSSKPKQTRPFKM